MTDTLDRPETATAAETARLLPPGFELGVAMASYQIEGAVHEDGRGPSIWDTFSHTPGKTARGDNGDVACDHFHRYREDVALMADLGVDAYRLSVAWPRIQPDGRGPVNRRGLDFYSRLVDELLGRGITPVVTLYHWDLPQPLEDAGGWPHRDTAHRFAEYAAAVQEQLGDRVRRWITLNEPYCSSVLGYGTGRHAPGVEGRRRLAGRGAPPAARPRPRRRRDAGGGPRGVVRHHAEPGAGRRRSPTSRRTGPPRARSLVLSNLLFTDPVLAGRYPAEAREIWSASSDFSFLRDGDLEVTSAPLDFLGVNYYFPARVREVPHDEPVAALRRTPTSATASPLLADDEVTEMGWPVDADGIRRLMLLAARDLPRPAAGLRHRERRAPDDTVEARCGGRPGADPLRRRAPAGARRGRGGGRRRARLLRVVAARQLRVGGGLRASGSGWCTWTTRRSSGCRRPASGGTAT